MRDTSVCWQKILAQGFSSATELLTFLALPELLASPMAEKQFRTRIPRSFAQRMQKGCATDPLLLQVLAVNDELSENNEYVDDPLQELAVNPLQGLIHKYRGRVLLTLTGACAVHCRYCFRRHFPYTDNNPGRKGWEAVIDYIRHDPSIHEVIFSGGDPLMATDTLLGDLLSRLTSIKHLKTVRFHTRIPIVLPERVDASFIQLLESIPLRKVMVLHSNHAQELDAQVEQICHALKQADVCLLNQSVLLKGVNDSVSSLVDLSERLFSCGVLPYYLHLLDKVAGAAHFDMPLAEALALYRDLQQQLPGYLLPRLAREEAGKGSKTLYV